MSECKILGLICPKCNSDEVYYENANTGSGKYTCQDCEFMGSEADFNYSVPVKDYKDLRVKLEVAERKVNMRGKFIELKDRMLSKAYQERDEARQQVESITKVKNEFYADICQYKKACDDLVVLKEKLYNQIDTKNATIASLRETIYKAIKSFISTNMDNDGNGFVDMFEQATCSLLGESLVATPTTRYERIEKAAKVISKYLKCDVNNEGIADDVSGICPNDCKCDDCPLQKLADALNVRQGDDKK